ncbi:MAG: alpha/beta hydrolase [Pseudomonadota bacterium]|nr:alpha/beta hydrolase [Pseudomonadota bacterium]
MATQDIRSRWVSIDGALTHYSETGSAGPNILAIHGGGHGSSGHAGMGALMRELGSDFQVYAPDSIGGYGLTDPNVPTPRGLLDRGPHALAFADAIGLEKFTVVGNSQGAFAAVKLALEHPDRVEGIVMIGSLTIAQSMGVDQAPTPPLKALMAYDGSEQAMRAMLEGLVKKKEKITDELIAGRQESATRPGGMEAMDRFLAATGGLKKDPILSMQMDLRTSLPVLTKHIPSIFIWGAEDPFSLPETGRAIEPLLPDVPFHWIEDAGHQVQTDQPEEVARVIREFVLNG